MKKLFCLLFLLTFLAIPQVAYADTQDDLMESVNDNLGNLDFSQVESVSGGYIGDILLKIQQIINGEYDSAESFLQMILALLGESFADTLPQLVSIFVILVLVGLVRKTAGGFVSQATDDIVAFVGIAVVSVSVISLTVGVYNSAREVIDKISALSIASLPIILTLVVANGGATLSAVCQPSMVMFSSVIIGAVKSVILPLSMFGLAFSFVSNLSQNVRVSKMSSFLNNVASWVLGIVFTVFSAFTSVQGISASVADGLTYRMAKFSVKNYIPILGGYVSDGFDVVVASTSLIKNAFGVVLLLVLALMIVKPLLSILCLNLGLQGVTALSEPIVEDKCSKMFAGVCKSLTFLSALVVAVAFMFSILVLVAINCANGV